MKIISQMSLFDQSQIEILGDLERLQLVIDNIPDEKIIQKLNDIRGNGRNDWPIIPMWHTFLASYVFQHQTVEQLLRELRRNSQLRVMCGIIPKAVKQADGSIKIFIAPSSSAYSKFLANLAKCQKEIDEAFEELVQFMFENLECFGEKVAGDGKALESYANTYNKNSKEDGRRDNKADWGVKKYTESTNEKGEKVITKKSWFGYRLHLISDVTYELPIAYEVTPASNSEKTEMLDLIKELGLKHPEIIAKIKYFLADKGYDCTELITYLENNDISPIIDICNKWKSGEVTKQYRDTDLVYTYNGQVFYTNEKGEQIKLMYMGYDKSSTSLRYGFHPQYNDNRVFRININEDRRIFTPVARDSKKWERLYKERTSIERINGRIDRDYGFENHTIRGLGKMKMFIGVAFIVQLSMAKGKILQNKNEHLAAFVS